MPHLWILDEEGWAVLPLDGLTGLRIDCRPFLPAEGRAAAGPAGETEVWLQGTQAGPEARRPLWWLLGGPAALLSLNGLPLAGGLRMLRDRDEIRLGARERLYYSTEALARVEPFHPRPAAEPSRGEPLAPHCPRCQRELREGDPVVRCPACQVCYHQGEDPGHQCWTYSERCSLCGQGTDLEAGYRWTPESMAPGRGR